MLKGEKYSCGIHVREARCLSYLLLKIRNSSKLITSICENLFLTMEDEYVGYREGGIDRHTRILNLERFLT